MLDIINTVLNHQHMLDIINTVLNYWHMLDIINTVLNHWHMLGIKTVLNFYIWWEMVEYALVNLEDTMQPQKVEMVCIFLTSSHR